MNCISSKIVNQKLIISGVQSILKNRQLLHSSYRHNHVFTNRSRRNPIYNTSLRFNNVTLVRFASTNVYQYSDVLGTESLNNLKDVGVNFSQSSPNTSELLSDFPAEVVEPTLNSLGLGNGTPSGLLQLGLEYMHVEFGIPWWGTIIITTVLIKLCMMPLVVSGKRQHIEYLRIMPELKAIEEKRRKAYLTGNEYEVEMYQLEFMKLLKERNVSPFRPMLPALAQGAVFVSFFWALSSMAALPVESLKTGGALWFSNLTVPDPYYIMPLSSGATMAFLLFVANDAFKMSEINNQYLKAVLYILPASVVVFSSTFPSLILLYWTTNNVLSMGQFFLFGTKAFQKHFNLPAHLQHTKHNPPL